MTQVGIEAPSVAGTTTVAALLEQRLATVGAAGSSAETALAASTPSALQAALGQAAAAQGGLGPLFADLAAALQSPALPDAVRAAVLDVLALQLPADPPPDAAAVQQAVAQSGLFLEARLASQGQTDAPDLKAALLKLAAALPADTAAATPRQTPPAPPYPDGPLLGQEAAISDLLPGAPLESLFARLSARTRAALARQTLMQAASAGLTGRSGAAQGGHTWMLELPLATGDGASIAELEIDADGRRGEGQARAWRTRFSLNLASTGPVHARLTLSGDRLRVALWAESGDTHAALAAQQPALHQALGAEGLSAQVDILAGAPERPSAPPAGRFLDRKL